MPHAIIVNGCDPDVYIEAFRPYKTQLEDGSILETRAVFLRKDGGVALVDALAIELGPAQHFFIAVERKRKQLTVRLSRHPSPARTPGVQALIAHVTREVLALGGEIEKTNLEGLEGAS